MLNDLEESRGKFVRQNRGKGYLGAWFRPKCWDASGNLIATGEVRLRALDLWANDRATGRQCPALGSEGMPHWSDDVDATLVTKLTRDVTADVTETVDVTADVTADVTKRPMPGAARVRHHRV